MIKEWYARWMYEWETRLTTRDENRVVRPLEWGFEWMAPFLESHGFESAMPGPKVASDPAAAEAAMVRINQLLIRHSETFFGYKRPADFRLEERHPQLYPTNVRPETLAQEAAIRRRAEEGTLAPAQFLRFTSPERTPYPENDLVNARWYPAPEHKAPARPGRLSWCCRSGTPTASATTPFAPSSIVWASRRCGSPCLTTTSAAPPSLSAPTTPSAPTSDARSWPAVRLSLRSAAALTG